MKPNKLIQESFNKGVDEVIFLRPLQKGMEDLLRPAKKVLRRVLKK